MTAVQTTIREALPVAATLLPCSEREVLCQRIASTEENGLYKLMEPLTVIPEFLRVMLRVADVNGITDFTLNKTAACLHEMLVLKAQE
jgi:hypothetical protein